MSAKLLQSCPTLGTPWTAAHQAPLYMGFSRQEYWSGLPCPPPGDLPNPGMDPMSLMSAELAGGFFTTRATWESFYYLLNLQKFISKDQMSKIIFKVIWELELKSICLQVF